MSIKDGKLIYHLTALDNLESIIKNGLKPREEINSNIDIADPKILEKRDGLGLLCMVLFHFFTKTPFDGAVRKSHEDINFIYICIRRETAKEKGFGIIPYHPLSSEQENTNVIYEYDEGFYKIKWDIIDGNNRDYNNQDIKNACMAECLYKGTIFYDLFQSIKVKDEETFNKVSMILKNCGFDNIDRKFFDDKGNSFFVDIIPGLF